MNLTTIDRVRVLLAGESDGGTPREAERRKRDSEIEAVIALVSGAVERYLGRSIAVVSRTEYLDVQAGQTMFRLRGYPVTTLTGAWFDPDQDFGSDSALDSTEYYNPTLNVVGTFKTRGALSLNADFPEALKVTYTGGMAEDTDAFVDAYPDIAGAVDQQVAHEWQRRGALGVNSISYPDGTTASVTFDRWIASVAQVLDSYKRISVG